ncbi:MAG: VOC family protein [Candidatus Binatia bacterium]|nr:VOC family protein [Candidatus Binatia bacterium]
MAIVKRAHHVSVQITDLERSRAFYEGVLGFEETERPDFGFPGVWYQLGDVQVHLIGEIPGMDRSTPPKSLSPAATHLAFQIDDYQATLDAVTESGVEAFGLGEEVGQLFVRDPDGNIIELIVPGGMLGRRK